MFRAFPHRRRKGRRLQRVIFDSLPTRYLRLVTETSSLRYGRSAQSAIRVCNTFDENGPWNRSSSLAVQRAHRCVDIPRQPKVASRTRCIVRTLTAASKSLCSATDRTIPYHVLLTSSEHRQSLKRVSFALDAFCSKRPNRRDRNGLRHRDANGHLDPRQPLVQKLRRSLGLIEKSARKPHYSNLESDRA
jgi:hypothetical protein